MTGKAEQKTFEAPDETRTFENGALDLLQIGGAGDDEFTATFALDAGQIYPSARRFD